MSIIKKVNEVKKKLKLPVIVEGRYDKAALASLFSGLIVTLDGFSVFNSKEKQAALRKIAANGVIVLTDSDGGGRQLRSFVSGMLPKEAVKHLYIPKIEGKERRKPKRSKEGFLGVEGMEADFLIRLLSPFCEDAEEMGIDRDEITMARFFSDGFSGRENSSFLRAALARSLSMPEDMTAKALLNAINLLSLQDEYFEFVNNTLQNQ